MDIIFLVSGNGGTLKFLDLYIELSGCTNLRIAHVIADRDCDALCYARNRQIPTDYISYNKKNPEKLYRKLSDFNGGVVVTNIHKILDEKIINLKKLFFINLHYSLLPAFAGLIGMQPIVEARKINACFLGATCHEVIAEVDAGVILGQSCLAANWEETDEELMEKVFRASNLVLLNSLQKLSGVTSNSRPRRSQYCGHIFNPAFCFPIDMFNEDFWKKVKNPIDYLSTLRRLVTEDKAKYI